MNFFSRDDGKTYNLALVGLPASGKSTFLARLYGAAPIASEGNQVAGVSGSYIFSFGLETSADERQTASLKAVKDLWDAIVTHEEREYRGKTTDKTDLTFHAMGREINGRRKILTADVPGDIFRSNDENQSDEEYKSSGLRDENIARFRQEFASRCPSCNSVIIIISADKMERADRQAIIRDVVTEIGSRNGDGEPICKIVAVSKVASRIGDGDRRDFFRKLRALERELRKVTKAGSLLRCVPFDSLADLVREGNGWRLPQNGREISERLPKGIMTPVGVMSVLMDMERRFYLRRKVLAVASALAAVVGIVGAWIWQGVSADDDLYEQAGGVNREAEREALERYLTSPVFGRMYFPGRYHLQEARERWRRLVFEHTSGILYRRLDNSETDLDYRKAQMDRIEDPSSGLFKFVDRGSFVRERDALNSEIAKTRDEWRAQVSNAVSCVRKSCESCGDIKIELSWPRMPSLTDELAGIVADEVKAFDREQAIQKDEEEKLSDLDSGKIDDYRAFLTEFAKRGPFLYARLQARRDSSVQNALNALEGRWKNANPYFVKAVAADFRKIVGKDPEQSGKLSRLENDVEEIIAGLEREYEEYNRKFNAEGRSVERLKICNTAIENLKDHPSIAMPSQDGWRTRKQTLHKQMVESEKAVGGLRQQVVEMSDRPEEQLSLVNDFLQKRGADVSQEKREEVMEMARHYAQQFREASNLWNKVVATFGEFNKDHTKYDECKDAFDRYEREVHDVQKRQNGIAAFDAKRIGGALADEKSKAEELKKKYLRAWESRVRDELNAFKTSAGALAELRKSMMYRQASSWIDDWLFEVEQKKNACVKGSGDDEFAKVKRLLQVKKDYEERLGLESTDWLDALQDAWNETHMSDVKTRAGATTHEKAIDLWNEYLNHPLDGSWEPYVDDAKKEIRELAKSYSDQLEKRIEVMQGSQLKEVTPNVYVSVTNELCRIEQGYNRPNVPENTALRNKIEDARTKAVDGLYAWYVKKLDGTLSELERQDGRAVVTKWSQLEDIQLRLDEMYGNQAIRGKLPVGGWSNFKNKVKTLKDKCYILSFRVNSFKFRVRRSDKDKMNFIPGFWLSLVKQGGDWPEILKRDEFGAVKDDAKHLSMCRDGDTQYVKFTTVKDDALEPSNGVIFSKDSNLALAFGLNRGINEQGGIQHVVLRLLDEAETPAALLFPRESKFCSIKKGLKYKHHRKHEFEYCNFELTVSLTDTSVVDDFKFPGTASEFLESIR